MELCINTSKYGKNSHRKSLLKGKILMEKKNQTKKLPGFYIALCCCVLGIGAAGFIAQRMETSSTNALTEVIETPEPILTAPPAEENAAVSDIAAEEPVSITVTESPAAAEEAAAIEDYTYDNPDLAPAAAIVNAEDSDTLADPLPEMTVIYPYYGDKLVYNELLEDWRTHEGVDLAANAGASVAAAADGTIESITDGAMGKEVVIDHGNGLKTVYAQLGEVSAAEGDTVSTGSVIGTIAPAKGETAREPHLHYEVINDGKSVDPAEY